jgi:staphyloferrin B biosynthesis citrate synthase
MTPAPASFRQRLLSSELLLGTFIKTPTTHATEILGGLGFDFVGIDEEHAPFDRVTIDNLLLAARASNVAGIVRVAESSPAKLLAVLDDGATGVLVPHVFSVGKAKDIVAACRYRRGKRGFSNSPRAGGYGQLGVWDHVDRADASVAVIAMIEDPEAIDVIDDIVAVERRRAPFCRRWIGGEACPSDARLWPAACTSAARELAGKRERFSGSAGEDAEFEYRTSGMFTPLRRFDGSKEERRGRRSRWRAMARSTARQASRPTARS